MILLTKFEAEARLPSPNKNLCKCIRINTPQYILVPSECENYYTFDQGDRNELSDEGGWYCDSSKKHTSKDWYGEGWYRFTGKAGESLLVATLKFEMSVRP